MQQYKYGILALVVLGSGCAATKEMVVHDRATDYKTAKAVELVLPEKQQKQIAFKQDYAIPAGMTQGALSPSDIPPGMENELK